MKDSSRFGRFLSILEINRRKKMSKYHQLYSRCDTNSLCTNCQFTKQLSVRVSGLEDRENIKPQNTDQLHWALQSTWHFSPYFTKDILVLPLSALGCLWERAPINLINSVRTVEINFIQTWKIEGQNLGFSDPSEVISFLKILFEQPFCIFP